MSNIDTLKLMKNRRNILWGRGKDNSKIVTKLNRKIRKLEEELK